MRILCEAQAVDMHLFLFAASEKSSRAFSKFEIVRMEPRNWEASLREMRRFRVPAEVYAGASYLKVTLHS